MSNYEIALQNPIRAKSESLSLVAIGYPRWLAEIFYPALNEYSKKVSYGTFKQRVYDGRRFGTFIEEAGLAKSSTVWPADVLQQFSKWLKNQKGSNGRLLSNARLSTIYGVVREIVAVTAHLKEDQAGHVELRPGGFGGKGARDRPISLSSSDLERISSIAAAECKETWRAYQKMRTDEAASSVLCRFLTSERLFPFYLLLMCDLAANPSSLAMINESCTEESLVAAFALVDWVKPRGNYSDQRVLVRAIGSDSVAVNIDRLREMTSLLRADAPDVIRTKLFLYHQNSGGGPGLAGQNIRILTNVYAAQYLLPRFRERHDIPKFLLDEIRVARLSSAGTGDGGIKRAQQLGNHLSPRDTLSYIMRGKEFSKQMQVRLASTMPLLLDSFSEMVREPSRSVVTALGSTCASISSGPENDLPAGAVCMSYLQCFSCPHCRIPTRDPETFHRLAAAASAIKGAEGRVSRARWEEVLHPVLNFITNSVLPQFPERIRNSSAEGREVPMVEIW